MTLTIEATYEGGILRPERALPLNEHDRVRLTVEPLTSLARQTAGLLRWPGDPETLRRLAEDPEFGILESP